MRVFGCVRDRDRLGGAHDLELQGALAFVAGKGAGGNREPPHGPGAFGIVDVSDPRRPCVVGGLVLPPEGDRWVQAETVLPAGGICYVGGSHFWAVDVRDPAAPRILARLDDPRIESINGMVRRGDFILAASKKNHVTVFDIRRPADPVLAAAYAPPGPGFRSPHDIARLGGDCAAVVNIKPEPGCDRLRVYRVADGDGPGLRAAGGWELLGALGDDRLAGANRILVRGTWAFVACNKGYAVATVDLSDPARPRLACVLPSAGRPCGLALAGDRLFAAGGGAGTFVEVYDVSDPERMALVVRGEPDGVSPDHDMICRDGLLYVTDQDQDQVAVLELEGAERPHPLPVPAL